MNPIWRVCFAASLFVLSVGARRVHANEEDLKLKFHRDLTNFVSVRPLSETLTLYIVIRINF